MLINPAYNEIVFPAAILSAFNQADEAKIMAE
jgi:predicted metalloendopeptidase